MSRKVCVLWFLVPGGAVWFLVPGGAALVLGHFEKWTNFFDVSRRHIAKPSGGLRLLTTSLNKLSSICDKPCSSERKTFNTEGMILIRSVQTLCFDEKRFQYCRRIKYRNKTKIEDIGKVESIILKCNPM